MTLTIADLERMKSHPDTMSPLIEYECTVTGIPQLYEDFVARINEEINSIIKRLEESRDYYNKLSEDALTKIICDMLKSKSIKASHGEYSSGETDLHITHGPYTWIGEAKWWNADANAYEGMRQLVTRYSSGRRESNNGAVLLYNNTSNSTEKIRRLRENYSSMSSEFPDIEVTEEPEGTFEFTTEHTHNSGQKIIVRHKLVLLHHNPNDKSARNRKTAA